MELADLPAWAEQQAAALLADLGDRWSHIQAVAARACRASAALTPEDRRYLIAAAWLHDVGYARYTGLAFIPSTAPGTCASRARSDWPRWSPTTRRSVRGRGARHG